ncbi:MAG: carbamoyltransferase, partial [Candidatus Solibacter usitatus]|nr:carbamoyltransferase [Candidatus Solibacter usitatus]
MIILGISGILSDPAVAIARDGELVAAVEEDKLSRQYRPGELPQAGIQACLHLTGAKAEEVDYVAVVRPVSVGPQSSFHLQLRSKFPNSRLVLVGHHAAHAASAYYASPFEKATVLTLDRTGDVRCGALWRASGNQVAMERELHFPDSLGDLYGRVTELLGFHSGADEHKVQWLSTAGDGRFRDLFLEILACRPGQWPRIDRSFVDSERMTRGGFSAKFYARLGLDDDQVVPEPVRAQVAAGLQQAIEQTVMEMAGSGGNLCLAGGLCYNALLVAALERSGRFDNVFVQPNAGNPGAALGAVFHTRHFVLREDARLGIGSFCLGPSYTAEEIKQVLENCKLRFRYLLTSSELIGTAVEHINEGKIVAWMHGRMEFGPRALGNRSILASPLDPYSTENLNAYIK